MISGLKLKMFSFVITSLLVKGLLKIVKLRIKTPYFFVI